MRCRYAAIRVTHGFSIFTRDLSRSYGEGLSGQRHELAGFAHWCSVRCSSRF